MQIGPRVQKLRIAHGESLREAAIRTGVSHTTIARLEKGAAAGSFDSTLRKIAAGYGVQVEYLLGGRDPKQEFTRSLSRLTPAERARLYFVFPRERIRMVMSFLLTEFPAEFTLKQLARACGVRESDMGALLQAGNPPYDVSRLEQRVADTLARLTGISSGWFLFGSADGEHGTPVSGEHLRAFATLMKKAAVAGIGPDELEMAIDLLIQKEKEGSR